MRKLNENEMKAVSGAGCGSPPPPPHCPPDPCRRPKGNNGWGNGAEGINNGSFSGATAGSKSDEVWNNGDGPRPSKHLKR